MIFIVHFIYLRAIKPPADILPDDSIKSVENACRILSYIPFVSDPAMFPGFCDLWTTVEQFLMMGYGDEDEHAVLLACWLMYLNIPTYIIIGSALPEGERSAFVLIELSKVMLLLNPSDGNTYYVNDAFCPLKQVGCAINNCNIYGNIQPYDHPSQMSFNFKSINHWKAIFETDVNDIESVQPSLITYTKTNAESVMELRSTLEREIRLKFDESRPYGIPHWNVLISRMLRELLNELDSMNPINDINCIENRLSELRRAYKINLTIFRQSYINVDSIIEHVLHTNLHMNSDQRLQFAFALHINAFVCNILSVSIAIASLSPLSS